MYHSTDDGDHTCNSFGCVLLVGFPFCRLKDAQQPAVALNCRQAMSQIGVLRKKTQLLSTQRGEKTMLLLFDTRTKYYVIQYSVHI